MTDGDMDSNINTVITNVMAHYIDHISKVLPDDVVRALERLRSDETNEAALGFYDTMFRNMELARQQDRPLCQDTGIVQFKVKCGTDFPALKELENSLIQSVLKATDEAPLRPNCVETFEEKNTGSNIGTGAPAIWWKLEPGADDCEICVYLAGGGCSLPGKAEVFTPSAGYDAIIPFVMDRVTELGLNACPPLLIGVGVGNSIETAAMNSKEALMRDIESKNDDPKASKLEELLEDGLNKIGIGPQGFGGNSSVMGVNIVNTVRHPATFALAVSFGCWCHRRGVIRFDRNLKYSTGSHSGFLG